MRKGFFAAVGAMALGGTAAFAEAPPAAADKGALLPPAQAVTVLPPAGGCATPLPQPGCEADAENPWGRVTLSADYLLWWVKKGPTPGPLLTIGSPTDTIPGALGQPGTVSLFGDQRLDYDTFSGVRLSGSVGITSDLAVEGSGFVLERRSAGFGIASDANGSPLIARPVISDLLGIAESYSTSFPGGIAGESDVVSHTQLQGFEVNVAAHLMRSSTSSLDVIAGYRYLDLREDLLFHDTLNPLVPDFLTFQGASVAPGNSVSDFDSFRTRNHFNGGQIGARWQQVIGHFDVGVTGKVALGATDSRVEINGGTTLNTPGAAPVTVPGGILAQVGNIGTYSHSSFSVVPEVGLNLGWRVTEDLTVNVGYTFLYWTHVARPGAQIDPRVNPFVVPTDQDFGAGPTQGHPLFGLHTSDFWAQGVNFGVTLRF